MVGFTSRKIKRAKLSSKMYNNVGLPTVKNFNHMVSTNMISNCLIEEADINNAVKIYGSLMEILKVKSIRSNPRPVIRYEIQIPSDVYKNNSNIELCIDVVSISGVVFLVSIYRQVKYRSIIHITSHNEDKDFKCLDKTL